MEERESSAVREVLRSGALSVLGRLARDPKRPFLRALYFHAVYDTDRANFKGLIMELSRLASFIGTQELLDVVEERCPVDRRCFHLSFDDGYQNFCRNAAPVLTELRIPALVFVVTETVGMEPVDGPDERIMSWDELREVHSQGFEVGSHTKTHPRLAAVQCVRALEGELWDSKREIEDHLGVECRYLAWPGGRQDDVDDRFFAAVEAAGYRACFGGFRGSVVPGRTGRFGIPRHHLEAAWPYSHVRYFATGHGE